MNVVKIVSGFTNVCVNFMNNVHNAMHFVFTTCIVKKDKYRIGFVRSVSKEGSKGLGKNYK